jgi:hypothetical protein
VKEKDKLYEDGKAWKQNAKRLAFFVHSHLVNRDDFYLRYRPISKRSDGKAYICKEHLSIAKLEGHFAATSSDAIIGLPTTSQDNQCRWMVIDIDLSSESTQEQAKINEQYGMELVKRIAREGKSPVLLRSSSGGRFHIWIILDRPVDASVAYDFVRSFTKDWSEHGLTSEPECFPKQRSLSDGKYGNSVRLPGLHHTEPFYSEVWSGECWLSGQQAIDRICSCSLFSAIEISNESTPVSACGNSRKTGPVGDYRTHNSNLGRILDKLRCVTKNGDSWTACCPAHSDSTPSLSLRLGEDNRVLVHCFAGCDHEKIVEALGMQVSDLFPPAPSTRAAIIPANNRRKKLLRINPASSSLQKLQTCFSSSICEEQVERLADDLGVSTESLFRIGIGWCGDHNCFTFPEFNGRGELCGVLCRRRSGSKFSFKGSKRGLTLPSGWKETQGDLYVCEGQTDVAAALSQGHRAIGLPGKTGAWGDIVMLLRHEKEDITVVADNDPNSSGIKEAQKLASMLRREVAPSVKLCVPPPGFKDLREFLTTGDDK